MLSVPAGASAATSSVTVRVEGQSRTLVPQVAVKTTGSPVVKDGNAAHSCPGSSAAGALERATAGRWSGIWFAGLGYEVTTIRGELHSGSKDYWTLWVNNRPSSTGVCQTALHRGDRILFFVAPDKGQLFPLGIRAPRRVRVGHVATITVVRYDLKGHAKAVAGALVRRYGKVVGRTDRHGHLRLHFRRRGLQRLDAIRHGYVRTAAVNVLVVR